MALRRLLHPATGSALRGTAAHGCLGGGAAAKRPVSGLARAAAAHADPTDHAAEDAFPTIAGLWRDTSGSRQSRALRREGLLPGALQGLPGNTTKNIVLSDSLVSGKIKKMGPLTFSSRAWTLELYDDEGDTQPQHFHVVPRLVHATAATGKVENVTFLAVEKGGPVKVDVMVEILGDDVSPGVKLGGFPFVLMRTLPLVCPSDRIPKTIQVDVSHLGTEGRVLLEEVQLPDGCSINAKNLHVPVVKVKGKARQPQPAA
mmetsp:Transcript_37757/g.97991  ORF Transcript_37757/g.97991 Transcript_37757/m.97991 type:complete len:259 (-) Transcript_37757:70-846(-)|eukprot:jgi/Tetstr1/443687/TSEL_031678.t1